MIYPLVYVYIANWKITIFYSWVNQLFLWSLKNRCLYVYQKVTGWWFGTCVFPYIGNNHRKWLSYVSEGVKPPVNQTWPAGKYSYTWKLIAGNRYTFFVMVDFPAHHGWFPVYSDSCGYFLVRHHDLKLWLELLRGIIPIWNTFDHHFHICSSRNWDTGVSSSSLGYPKSS